MATENTKDGGGMRRFVQGQNKEIERQIDETETLLVNTRRFLDQLALSQEQSREYIEKFKKGLEDRLHHLHNRREKRENGER